LPRIVLSPVVSAVYAKYLPPVTTTNWELFRVER